MAHTYGARELGSDLVNCDLFDLKVPRLCRPVIQSFSLVNNFAHIDNLGKA